MPSVCIKLTQTNACLLCIGLRLLKILLLLLLRLTIDFGIHIYTHTYKFVLSEIAGHNESPQAPGEKGGGGKKNHTTFVKLYAIKYFFFLFKKSRLRGGVYDKSTFILKEICYARTFDIFLEVIL